mgnify:CR=1 FL=1
MTSMLASKQEVTELLNTTMKKLTCERYENCFQCPLGKDSFDDEGNLINICTYDVNEVEK